VIVCKRGFCWIGSLLLREFTRQFTGLGELGYFYVGLPALVFRTVHVTKPLRL
jgi:hypothetical protein